MSRMRLERDEGIQLAKASVKQSYANDRTVARRLQQSAFQAWRAYIVSLRKFRMLADLLHCSVCIH